VSERAQKKWGWYWEVVVAMGVAWRKRTDDILLPISVLNTKLRRRSTLQVKYVVL
jgi:hypothetical protein